MNNGISTRFSARAALALAFAAMMPGCMTQSPAPVFGPGDQPSAAVVKNVYVVKKGDTLYSIAREYATDPKELAVFNGIENPAQISVGQTIKIPDAGAARTAGAEATAVTQPVTSEAGSVESRPLETSTPPGVAGNAPVNVKTEVKTEPKAGKEPYSDEAFEKARAANGEAKTEPPAPAPVESSWVWPSTGKVVKNYNGSENKGIDIGGKVGDPVVAAEAGRVILVSDTLRSYGNMIIVSHGSKLVTVYAHNSKILVKEKQAVKRGQKIAEMGKTDVGQVILHFEVRDNGQALDPVKFLPVRPR
ncbi:MAG: peptidoglycan DD-metalloendopeptidase family protein [Candidatus Accumulibacter sp.]|jgi:lipoprotein NlpD|nr:peptidoglycan DD-metalloendopeptidase family protein [Accumulibacter sp.]